MEQLVSENNSFGRRSLFLLTGCLRKNSSGLTSPDSVSEKFNQLEQTPRKDDRLSGEKTKVDVVYQANRKICVTLLRYIEDRPESSTSQVLFFARKNEDEKFEQTV